MRDGERVEEGYICRYPRASAGLRDLALQLCRVERRKGD